MSDPDINELLRALESAARMALVFDQPYIAEVCENALAAWNSRPSQDEQEAIDRKCLTPGCTYSTHLSSYNWDSKCTSIKIHIGLSAPLRVPGLGMCYLPKGNKTTKEEYLQRVEDILHDNLEHAVAEIGEFDLLCGGIMAKTWPSLGRLRSPAPEWRPISEAPAMRKILAGYRNRLGNWRTVLATYYLPNTLEAAESLDIDDEYAPAGWYEETETHDDLLPLDFDPTHFQMLPTPPTASTQEG